MKLKAKPRAQDLFKSGESKTKAEHTLSSEDSDGEHSKSPKKSVIQPRRIEWKKASPKRVASRSSRVRPAAPEKIAAKKVKQPAEVEAVVPNWKRSFESRMRNAGDGSDGPRLGE